MSSVSSADLYCNEEHARKKDKKEGEIIFRYRSFSSPPLPGQVLARMPAHISVSESSHRLQRMNQIKPVIMLSMMNAEEKKMKKKTLSSCATVFLVMRVPHGAEEASRIPRGLLASLTPQLWVFSRSAAEG